MVCYSRPTVYAYEQKFVSVYSVALCWGKIPILPFFGLRHLVVSTVAGNLRKWNTDAQLQTFPYPMASKSFLYSSAFMAKSGAQSLTFKSVTDKQTDKLETVSIAEPLQNRHHAPLMLSTLGSKEKREGG